VHESRGQTEEKDRRREMKWTGKEKRERGEEERRKLI
jgi:hypothetical protein